MTTAATTAMKDYTRTTTRSGYHSRHTSASSSAAVVGAANLMRPTQQRLETTATMSVAGTSMREPLTLILPGDENKYYRTILAKTVKGWYDAFSSSATGSASCPSSPLASAIWMERLQMAATNVVTIFQQQGMRLVTVEDLDRDCTQEESIQWILYDMKRWYVPSQRQQQADEHQRPKPALPSQSEQEQQFQQQQQHLDKHGPESPSSLLSEPAALPATKSAAASPGTMSTTTTTTATPSNTPTVARSVVGRKKLATHPLQCTAHPFALQLIEQLIKTWPFHKTPPQNRQEAEKALIMDVWKTPSLSSDISFQMTEQDTVRWSLRQRYLAALQDPHMTIPAYTQCLLRYWKVPSSSTIYVATSQVLAATATVSASIPGADTSTTARATHSNKKKRRLSKPAPPTVEPPPDQKHGEEGSIEKPKKKRRKSAPLTSKITEESIPMSEAIEANSLLLSNNPEASCVAATETTTGEKTKSTLTKRKKTPKADSSLTDTSGLATGNWRAFEKRLLSQGIKDIGWGNWKDITLKYLKEYRSRSQVASFARYVYKQAKGDKDMLHFMLTKDEEDTKNAKSNNKEQQQCATKQSLSPTDVLCESSLPDSTSAIGSTSAMYESYQESWWPLQGPQPTAELCPPEQPDTRMVDISPPSIDMQEQTDLIFDSPYNRDDSVEGTLSNGVLDMGCMASPLTPLPQMESVAGGASDTGLSAYVHPTTSSRQETTLATDTQLVSRRTSPLTPEQQQQYVAFYNGDITLSDSKTNVGTTPTSFSAFPRLGSGLGAPNDQTDSALYSTPTIAIQQQATRSKDTPSLATPQQINNSLAFVTNNAGDRDVTPTKDGKFNITMMMETTPICRSRGAGRGRGAGGGRGRGRGGGRGGGGRGRQKRSEIKSTPSPNHQATTAEVPQTTIGSSTPGFPSPLMTLDALKLSHDFASGDNFVDENDWANNTWDADFSPDTVSALQRMFPPTNTTSSPNGVSALASNNSPHVHYPDCRFSNNDPYAYRNDSHPGSTSSLLYATSSATSSFSPSESLMWMQSSLVAKASSATTMTQHAHHDQFHIMN